MLIEMLQMRWIIVSVLSFEIILENVEEKMFEIISMIWIATYLNNTIEMKSSFGGNFLLDFECVKCFSLIFSVQFLKNSEWSIRFGCNFSNFLFRFEKNRIFLIFLPSNINSKEFFDCWAKRNNLLLLWSIRVFALFHLLRIRAHTLRKYIQRWLHKIRCARKKSTYGSSSKPPANTRMAISQSEM